MRCCKVRWLFLCFAGAFAVSNAWGRNSDVAISELHYNPVTSSEDEFIELYNRSADPVDVSGWTLSEGVRFVIPESTAISPLGYLVLAKNAVRFAGIYPGVTPVVGNFDEYLDDGDDTIALRDREGFLVDRVAYQDEDPWPENPDGLGPSLERTRFDADGEQQWVWRSSIPTGGTPGAPNSTISSTSARQLIARGDRWSYFKGTAEPAMPIGAWAGDSFNASGWPTGPSGFGYGATEATTLLTDMNGNYTTAYIRTKFALADPSRVLSLVLTIVYDDAYVIYLNGEEVARSAGAGGTPGTPLPFSALATQTVSVPLTAAVDLTDSPLLRAGDNTLAIQGLNVARTNRDFLLLPTLSVQDLSGGSLIEPPHDVEINEVFVGGTLAESFVELHNEGAGPANIGGFRVTNSPTGQVGYAFPGGTTLASGQFTSVTGNQLPFALTNNEQWIGLVTGDGRFVDGVRARSRPAGRAWGRYPDGDGDTFVLDAPTRGTPNAFTRRTDIVITEIRYHPPLAEALEEYIEILNRGTIAVDLSGWTLDKAVHFTFPEGVIINRDAYLVIALEPLTIQSRYGISGVVGPWTGRLSNANEKIELLDAIGNRVDVVNYADDGTWPASTDIPPAGPDGFGESIELVNPGMENNHGSAWAASGGTGTPGRANARAVADPAPVIRSVAHDPPHPLPADVVTVSCRVTDERGVGSVRLNFRNDGTTSFTNVAMAPDVSRGQDYWSATIPARAAGTIVQFYVSATDSTSHTRTFPAAAPDPTCLYQVDDATYTSGLPLYRLVMRQSAFTELTTRDEQSDVLLDGTFIRGNNIFYNIGVRYRGDNSRNAAVKSIRVDLNQDERFEGITRLNLNALDTYLSHLATNFMRLADIPTFQSRVVAFTLNRNWNNAHGGIYQRVEATDEDFVEREFFRDAEGNFYRTFDLGGGQRADLRYLGPDPEPYMPIYPKRSNREENDYSDLIELTDTLNNEPDATYADRISALVDVDEWLRFFAAETVVANQDGCIATNGGEDYRLYHRTSDDRWVLIPWDLNETWQNANTALFRMSVAAVQRFVLNPAFVGRYLDIVKELVAGPLDRAVMRPFIDDLRAYYPAGGLDAVDTFIPARQSAVRAMLPDRLTVEVQPYYLVRSGETWLFFRGRSEPSGGTLDWTTRTFPATGWEEGPSGFGYGDNDDRTTLADMLGSYTTVYIRRHFPIANLAAIGSLSLSIRYDDGFVVYLNGTEIARRNAPNPVRFDDGATSDHEAGTTPTAIDVTAYKDVLLAGDNVIAAVGLNQTLASSDVTLDPELYAQPLGSGCGGLLFVGGGNITLGGVAPIGSTAAVLVNGFEATYQPQTGTWRHDVDTAAVSSVLVQAIDHGGHVIASETAQLASGATSFTTTGGTLTTRRWTLAESPYLITTAANVPAGATLTIDPGVVVFVGANVSITVQGALDALGTPAKPILFHANDCDGLWTGIQFLGTSARGNLQNCNIGHALGGTGGGTTVPACIAVAGGARVTLAGCTIAKLRCLAIEAVGQASRLEAYDTIFEDTSGAVRADTAWCLLERATIRNMLDSRDAVHLAGESTPQSIVRNCTIENGPGFGISLSGSSALLEGNSIRGMDGGGICVEGASSPSGRLNVIYQSTVGIICQNGAQASLERCTITQNAAGLRSWQEAAQQGGGVITAHSMIVWGNGIPMLVDAASSVGLTWSDVQGGFAGTGNKALDPRFVDSGAFDFRLMPNSPAIGAGLNGVDMGALPSTGAPPVRFRRGDANADGKVDISDAARALLILFASRTTSCWDAIDANDDGNANVADAIAILTHLFGRSGALPHPFSACGADSTTQDQLDCDSFAPCP